jgi:hypothetical protein
MPSIKTRDLKFRIRDIRHIGSIYHAECEVEGKFVLLISEDGVTWTLPRLDPSVTLEELSR